MKAPRAASMLSVPLRVFLPAAVTLAGFLFGLPPRQSPSAATQSNKAASPEIARLWNVFSGDWKTSESMERGEFFPNGGARSGDAPFGLGDGGAGLVEGGYSHGPAGQLALLIVHLWVHP